jgi:hypothetical protein
MVQRTEKNRFLQVKIALAFLFINVTLFAQNKGLVLDKESDAPLSGVNVSLNNKKVLSKTNDNGEFYLKRLYKFNPKDTLWFSYIGYSTKKIAATDIKGANNTIYLFKDTLSLKEITVTSNKRPLDESLNYTKLASLKVGVSSFGLALVGNKIYVFGGNESAIKSIASEEETIKSVTKLNYHIDWRSFSNKLQIYDIPTDSWQISNVALRKRAFENVIYYKDRLYIFGGKNLSTSKRVEYLDNTIELYDMKQNKCFLDKTNPHPGVNCASFIYDSNLIVMGGSIKENEIHKIYSKKAHLQNLKTGLWYELPDMPTAKETKGIIIDNTVYLIGGFNDVALSNIECYNIKSGKWETIGNLPHEVKRPAIAYNDDIIYIYEYDKIQTVNIKTNEIKAYPIDLTVTDCELVYYDKMLYIIGGLEPNSGYSSASKNLYRININDFKKTETINQ